MFSLFLMHGDIASCENDWANLEKSVVEGTFREASLVIYTSAKAIG